MKTQTVANEKHVTLAQGQLVKNAEVIIQSTEVLKSVCIKVRTKIKRLMMTPTD